MSTASTAGVLDRYVRSWERHLRAANKSPKTIKSYLEAAGQLADFLAARDRLTDPAEITQADVEDFMVHLLDQHSASTAATRYRGLQQFFNWLVAEGEREASPMEGLKPPKPEQKDVPVLDDATLKTLLRTCQGKDFEQRRDTAIIRAFIDTGMRLAEMAGLRTTDVDLDRRLVLVRGKGRKQRTVPLGNNAVRDLDRYLERSRPRHPHANDSALWLGLRGPMTADGIGQMVRRRCREAGIDPINPHQFRHTFAHSWLGHGGGERDLMMLAGWESPQMLGRYGSSLAAERAREAHQKLSPGDRV